MNKIDNYLLKISEKRINPSLTNFSDALQELLKEEKNSNFVRFIVGGTNGKGSTAYFLHEILKSSGYKTGLLSSPHICTICERVLVDSEFSENQWFEAINNLLHLIKKYSLTYYESTVLISYYFFIKNKIDIAVMEVGLGGRWDAVRVGSKPFVIITSIGLDHQNFLGNNRNSIATEKSFLIDNNSIVITGFSDKKIISILKKRNPKQLISYNKNFFSKKLSTNRDNFTQKISYNYLKYNKQFILSNPSNFWRKNFSTALTAAVNFDSKIINNNNLKNIAENIKIPGRFERISYKNKELILDVSHNPQGWRELFHNINNNYNIDKIGFLVGILKDKNWKKLLKKLNPTNTVILLLDNERAISKREFLQYFPDFNITSDYQKALDTLNFNTIIITGSFYTVEQIRCMLQK